MSKASTNSGNPAPGEGLYNLVRSIFTRRGSSLHAWCAENGVNPSSARQALYGYSKSEDSRALRERLIRAANLMAEHKAASA